MVKQSNIVIKVINHIELNIYDSISLDDLSVKFNYSKYYLHRTFKNITGITLARYIRCRKLIHSLRYLDEKKFRIIDIAFLYNFDYEQSYIRSFKSYFNMTPNTYRKERPILEIMNKQDISDLLFLKENIVLTPKKVFVPTMNLIGKEYTIRNRDPIFGKRANHAGNDFVNSVSKNIVGDVDTDVYISVVKYLNRERDDILYTPSYKYNSLESYPEGTSTKQVKGNEYISFKYIGHHSPYLIDNNCLKDTYDMIYSKYFSYLKSSCNTQEKIEVVDRNKCREDYCEMDILFPVKYS